MKILFIFNLLNFIKNNFKIKIKLLQIMLHQIKFYLKTVTVKLCVRLALSNKAKYLL